VAADPKYLSSVIRFDLFELDPSSFQLRRSGVVVDLPPQALRILVLLTAHPNELVTRKQIKDALWPEETHGDFDSRMNFALKKLRDALGDSAEQPRYVQTVRNAGYMFIAPVRLGAGSANASAHVMAGVEGAGLAQVADLAVAKEPAPAKFRLGLRTVMVAVIALAVSAVAFGRFILKPHEADADTHATSASASTAQSAVDGVPEILSVSDIVAKPRQRIVIKGRGFGLHVAYEHTDSPFLAIRDETRDWAAGRMVPQNQDEVMLDVESWTDDEIVINGFSGKYGRKGWALAEADKLEVRVWNPETGTGPAKFHIVVSSAGATR